MWTKLRQQLWQWRSLLIITPSVAGLVILLRFTGIIQFLEWAAFDQYVRLRPQEPPEDRIAIVGINEADLHELIGQDYIPDKFLAQLLLKLQAKKPRAIGLDIYRDLPVEPGHADLVKVYQNTTNLIGIHQIIGAGIPPSPILQAKGQIGANGLLIDPDAKVRRGFLSIRDREGKQMWSFAMLLALHYLQPEGIKPPDINAPIYRIGKSTFPAFTGNDGGYVRANDSKYQILLNYRGPQKYFHSVSMKDVLQDNLPPDWGRDRIILVGNVGEIFEDFVFSPFNSGFPLGIERTARVEIHANQISQILSTILNQRPLIKTWSDPLECLWILLWSGVGACLIWQLRTDSMSKISLHQIIEPFLAAIALFGITFLAFLTGWWIPVIPPLLALSGSAIAITAYLAHSAGMIRKTFGRYLTDEVVANLLEQPDGLKLGGERRNITILTSDLRGFTAISERLPAEEVIKIINLYLGYMADVITQYQGTIDEFMGDGILVLFGAPTSREDDAIRAIACAVSMQLAMEPVNQTMQELGLPHLEMGIGINTGEVVVGNIGSEKRSKYGIVGDQVNLTYRIESYSIGGQILISESTLKQVESLVRIAGQKSVQPKGVKQPITIYEIGGIAGKYNLYLHKATEIYLTLSAPLFLQYTVLDGKHIDSNISTGKLIKLSDKGAEIYLEENSVILAPLTNIKLNLLLPNSELFSADMYAKVLAQTTANNYYIHFTNQPPEVEQQLQRIYQSLKSQ
ncbi:MULTISPECIES: CHASE2 domain-containing protein [Calothrix]|uniref:Adenylate/guanylate cyclase domain-containing protein n=2 Tax=Calothrix TaxID=1186 RepID=A0ABR8AJX9_9CYAN|nr:MULTISPECIES: adenylate/guanylate cyclase domain-containing protein [Calothrix]MBD2200360.1 adenylate/guanylate cyclase domain-containing protein [Calothrix parietina FACHB-288]MBD2229006.1 adenylate/guanylate cyclase domain-containing protein [Calothrix anomala FACHB-343]